MDETSYYLESASKLVDSQSLVEANLRLVPKVAKAFMRYGVSFDDLIQEGNLALIKAAQFYDPSRKVKFSTYAVRTIQNELRRFLENNTLIRIPNNLYRAIRGKECLTRDKEYIAAAKRTHTIMPKQEPASNFEGDRRYRFLDLLADNRQQRFDSLDFYELKEAMLKILDERERQVIDWYFGLTDKPLILAQIGERLGLSGEAARLIKFDAIEKLRRQLGGYRHDDTENQRQRRRRSRDSVVREKSLSNCVE